MTPLRVSHSNQPHTNENVDPNLFTPKKKSGNSPLVKSAKSKKSEKKTFNQVLSPRNKLQDRKFIVAKKKKPKAGEEESVVNAPCKCGNKIEGTKKCPCIAYQNLRASQEEFFKIRRSSDHDKVGEEGKGGGRAEEGEEKEEVKEITETGDGVEGDGYPSVNEVEMSNEMGSSTLKRRRNKVLEEARESVPEPGDGRVMHLVQAFEKLLTIPRSKKSEEKGEEEERDEDKKGMKWAVPLPGLQPQSRALETQRSLSSFTPSELFFTSDNFGMDSRVSSSFDSSRGSFSGRISGGGRRSRRNSSESTGTFGGSKWKKKQLKVTRQKPFRLRTEQRGRMKEEEFIKKVQEMCMEEEKLRIPIAQGLPWTTDEPECLLKPPVKESTKPIEVKLHSDVRAMERAEFDQHVSEKMSLIEQYKLERERQQKLAEEEELRRLRRELVPRAQPMPYFDRPFIPQRSLKHPTIPKEPKFHIPQHKKIKCMLWNDINAYNQQQH